MHCCCLIVVSATVSSCRSTVGLPFYVGYYIFVVFQLNVVHWYEEYDAFPDIILVACAKKFFLSLLLMTISCYHCVRATCAEIQKFRNIFLRFWICDTFLAHPNILICFFFLKQFYCEPLFLKFLTMHSTTPYLHKYYTKIIYRDFSFSYYLKCPSVGVLQSTRIVNCLSVCLFNDNTTTLKTTAMTTITTTRLQ